jgi:CHAD domain-containing protein
VTVGIEREVKLVAPPTFRLPDLTVAANGSPAVVLPPQRLQATYYDTVDLRLIRWGVTVRYRTGEEGGPVWTVKVPAVGAKGEGLSRRELNFRGRPGAVPDEAMALIRGFVRHAAIAPVAKLATRRHRAQVRDGNGHPLLEVADDVVSVLDNRQVAARFREVEVEVQGDASDELLRAVVDRLREAGASSADSTPKVIWALGPRATGPPEVEPFALGAESSGADTVRAAISAAVTRLLQHDVGARLGDDAEDVHQARVATRRLRSDLRTFRDLVQPEWGTFVREELRWLAGRLGAVRDTDVLLERLSDQVTRLPEQDRRAATGLLKRLNSDREAAREELHVALQSDRYVDLVEELVHAARMPKLLPEADLPATEILPQLVRKPWKQLQAAVAALGDDPEDDKLHEVRIRTKRARYAAEAVSPVMGKPAKLLGGALASLQSVLGDLQDGTVAEEWLRSTATRSRGAAAIVAGQLVAVQHAEMALARKRWKAAWKAASRKSLRSWMT